MSLRDQLIERDVLISPDAFDIAFEHVEWCRGQGLLPDEIIAAFGAPRETPDWADAIWAVALAQEALQRECKHAAELRDARQVRGFKTVAQALGEQTATEQPSEERRAREAAQ